MALVKMAEEFGGLPMESLIGGPLQAACDAQTMLAGATARFIEEVGLVKEGDGQSSVSVDPSGRYYLRYGSKIFGNSVGNRR